MEYYDVVVDESSIQGTNEGWSNLFLSFDYYCDLGMLKLKITKPAGKGFTQQEFEIDEDSGNFGIFFILNSCYIFSDWRLIIMHSNISHVRALIHSNNELTA